MNNEQTPTNAAGGQSVLTAGLCGVCGRPPHVCDDPECMPATKPIAEQLRWALGKIEVLRKDNEILRGELQAQGSTNARLRDKLNTKRGDPRRTIWNAEADPESMPRADAAALCAALEIALENLEDTAHLIEIDVGKDKVLRSLAIKAKHAADALKTHNAEVSGAGTASAGLPGYTAGTTE